MSTETTETETPKKSFLTRLLEKTEARLDGEESTAPKKIDPKKILIGLGATVAGITAVYAAVKVVSNMQDVEETDTETPADESTDN
ncbi:hypothetical protein SEA_SENDITCS_38 [Streptomyces phage SendItCS]|nr:hypothetical protein SEA_SENDITCS_38 [Streptomyces phage SendItCS]